MIYKHTYLLTLFFISLEGPRNGLSDSRELSSQHCGCQRKWYYTMRERSYARCMSTALASASGTDIELMYSHSVGVLYNGSGDSVRLSN